MLSAAAYRTLQGHPKTTGTATPAIVMGMGFAGSGGGNRSFRRRRMLPTPGSSVIPGVGGSVTGAITDRRRGWLRHLADHEDQVMVSG